LPWRYRRCFTESQRPLPGNCRHAMQRRKEARLNAVHLKSRRSNHGHVRWISRPQPDVFLSNRLCLFSKLLSLALTFPISVVSRFILIAVPFDVAEVSFLIARQPDRPCAFFDTPYWCRPQRAVPRTPCRDPRAMRHKTMVALGALVLSKREQVIALEPYGKGLLGTTPRYPYEVRDPRLFRRPAGAAARPDMLALAAQASSEAMVADSTRKSFRDRYGRRARAPESQTCPVRSGRISHCIYDAAAGMRVGDFKDFANCKPKTSDRKIRHPHSMGVVRSRSGDSQGRGARCVWWRGR